MRILDHILESHKDKRSIKRNYEILSSIAINHYQSHYDFVTDLIGAVQQAHNGLNQEVATYAAKTLVEAYKH